MRVLVTGDFLFDIYEPSFCRGLERAGAEVHRLPVARLFGPTGLARRAQSKLVFGPGPELANAALLRACARVRPDVVLAWRTPWLRASTIRLARRLGARALVLHNNDDPFGPDRDRRIWRRYRRLVPFADACFAYRMVNIAEYRAAGARDVRILRSWYDPALHRPIALSSDDRARFACDVVFVGHAENDSRLDALDALVESGLHVRLFGTSWAALAPGRRLASLLPVVAAVGDDYTRAIAAAKLALVFLSARNRDQYTRRCFEIPAIGTAMLAPRTDELSSLFADDEAVFFSSIDELVTCARAMVADDTRRAAVAAAGHTRVIADGHDHVGRARGFLDDVEGILGRRVSGPPPERVASATTAPVVPLDGGEA